MNGQPSVVLRHPVAAALTGGVIAAQAVRSVGMSLCPRMTMTDCVTTAVLVVAVGSLAAMLARAVWLGAATGRAVSALTQSRPPAWLPRLAHEAGVLRLEYLTGTEVAAFCAGLMRPRVYLTSAACDVLTAPQLAAVLAHEAAHARRRDPLRRLAARAAADVLFYLPVTHWWTRRHIENAELAADRAAIAHAGRKTVAAALVTVAGDVLPADPATVATGAFHDAADARIAQLLGENLPLPRPTRAQVVFSLLGLVAAVWLAMCLGQAALAQIGPL